MIIQEKLQLNTKGFNDIIDITSQIQDLVDESKIRDGYVLVFVPGATGGLTTIEFEPGLLQDLPEMFEKIAPMNYSYFHDKTWHDGNGYAHLRSALIGPDITIPIQDKKLVLGTWQQVIFLDFDNRPRQRNLHIQISGEID
jgi:secondary thiamine-phosphate synthase enzyme